MKILITEDMPLVIALYSAVLAGFPTVTCDFADSSDASRAKFNSSDYDLFFFDLNLNNCKETGLDLIEQLHSLDKNKDIPVFLATSQSDPITRQAASKLGVTGVVPKDGEFLSTIRLLVQNRAATMDEQPVPASRPEFANNM